MQVPPVLEEFGNNPKSSGVIIIVCIELSSSFIF